MKKFLISAFIIVCSLSGYAQGVIFEELSLEQALAKAKQENKYVMVDLYASTCGPCYKMLRDIFPLKEVGDYFNSNFINVKYLTDQEEEGKAVKKKYPIKAVPTYLFLAPDGTEMHRAIGYMDQHRFIAIAQRAKEKKSCAKYLIDKHEHGGKMNKLDLMHYYLALRDANKKEEAQDVQVKLEKMLTPKDLLQPEYWEYLAQGNYRTSSFQFVLQNTANLLNSPNSTWINDYLIKNFTDTIKQIVRNPQDQPDVKMAGICELISNTEFPAKKELQPRAELLRACYTKNQQAMVENLNAIVYSDHVDSVLSDDLLFNAMSLFSKSEYANFHPTLIPALDRLIDRFDAAKRPSTSSYVKLFVKRMTYRQGISFEYRYSLQDAMDAGKPRGRNVFVEVNTTHPMMGKLYAYITGSNQVGDSINKKYISISLDASTPEGAEVIKRYQLPTIPCYLIVSSEDGSLIHKFALFNDEKEFIAQVKKASNPEEALGHLENLAAKHQLTKQQHINYILGLYNVGQIDERTKQVENLFNQLNEQERFSKEYWPAMSLFEYGTTGFNYYLSHQKELQKQLGDSITNSFFKRAYRTFNTNLYCIGGDPRQAARMIFKTKPEALKAMEQLRKDIKMDRSPNREYETLTLNMLEAYLNNDFDKWVKAIDKISENYDHELHQLVFPLLISWAKDQCTTMEKVESIANLRPKFIEAMKNLNNTERASLAVFAPFVTTVENAKKQ